LKNGKQWIFLDGAPHDQRRWYSYLALQQHWTRIVKPIADSTLIHNA
jgi:hypothetical protein